MMAVIECKYGTVGRPVNIVSSYALLPKTRLSSRTSSASQDVQDVVSLAPL